MCAACTTTYSRQGGKIPMDECNSQLKQDQIQCMFFHYTLVCFYISLPAKLWEPWICLCSQPRVSELCVHRYLFLLDSVLSPDSSINFTLCLPGLVQAPSFSSCGHWQILWNGRDAVSPKMLCSLWWHIHDRDGRLCPCCATLQITSVILNVAAEFEPSASVSTAHYTYTLWQQKPESRSVGDTLAAYRSCCQWAEVRFRGHAAANSPSYFLISSALQWQRLPLLGAKDKSSQMHIFV